jgi:hypothetical protein
VCTCVFACIEMSWLDPGRDHGDGVTLIIIVETSITITLHAQIWPVLRATGHMEQSERTNLGQFRFTKVKLISKSIIVPRIHMLILVVT